MSIHTRCRTRCKTHDDHLLAVRPTERLCPPDFTWVTLHLEVFVAFGGAETETLCVIPDKHGTMSRVDIDGAEVALFDTHGGWWCGV